MCNSIFIDKNTIPKAKEGEEVEITIKGTYHTKDGVRKLDVEQVDGYDVVPPDEEESDCGCGGDENYNGMDTEDALQVFLIKNKKSK